MPEAPDLQVVLEYLQPRLVGRSITGARETRPLVLRNLTGERFSDDIADRGDDESREVAVLRVV
jgi:formamidopyrimidine-DNA glycosylase